MRVLEVFGLITGFIGILILVVPELFIKLFNCVLTVLKKVFQR